MSDLQLRVDHAVDDGFHVQIKQNFPGNAISALFGASGSGKTTVLDCIAGLRPDISNADLRFRGRSWQSGKSRLPPWNRPVGYVFQDARLFPHLNVQGNLDFALTRNASGKFSVSQVIDWLDIGPMLPRMPATLSAGQQQRVAIARALLRDPQLLLLDEPLVNLDRAAASECLNCLSHINRESKLPMIYVSHQIEEVCAIASNLVVLDNGKVRESGPLLELAGRLDSRMADDEAAAAILNATVVHRDDHYSLCELQVDQGTSIWVSSNSPRGSQRRLRIPARDVSVCRERPRDSSILNILSVTLAEVRAVSNAHCMLRLRLRDKHLLARITQRSRDELKLEVGDHLFAQIKSTALLGEGINT